MNYEHQGTMNYLSLFLFACFLVSPLKAEKILEGYTVVKGNNFAFELKAPRGWILDNEIAREQGLNVVFYPSGTDWGSSQAVFYVRVRTYDANVHTIEQQVADTLKNLHDTGSPNAKAVFVKTLTTQDASKAQIYNYSGDKYGNFEASAYIAGDRFLHFITLSARNEATFKQARHAFEALVTSYEDLAKASPKDPNRADQN
jgi:hypothetical protein